MKQIKVVYAFFIREGRRLTAIVNTMVVEELQQSRRVLQLSLRIVTLALCNLPYESGHRLIHICPQPHTQLKKNLFGILF